MKSTPAPGAALLGWPSLIAGALILWNDFWLRPRYPGFWSGKLSNVGIAFLLPVFLAALAEWLLWIVARASGKPFAPAGAPVRLGACGLATAYFAAMELWPAFGRFHAAWLSLVWPWGNFRPGTADPTDLAALVLVLVAWWYLKGAGRK